MKRNFLLCGMFAALAGAPAAQAQSIWPSTLNAAGGFGYIGTKEFEWSVGEMTLVSTVTTPSIVVTQGLLQTNLGNETNAVVNNELATQMQVFPNPTSSTVNIQFNSASAGTLTLRLVDMSGKNLITEQQVVKQGANATKIDLSQLAAATYMLQATFEGASAVPTSNTYKIQKLQ